MTEIDEKRDYELLKAHGHSPAKAAEIILDVKRGNTYALMWLNLARYGEGAEMRMRWFWFKTRCRVWVWNNFRRHLPWNQETE